MDTVFARRPRRGGEDMDGHWRWWTPGTATTRWRFLEVVGEHTTDCDCRRYQETRSMDYGIWCVFLGPRAILRRTNVHGSNRKRGCMRHTHGLNHSHHVFLFLFWFDNGECFLQCYAEGHYCVSQSSSRYAVWWIMLIIHKLYRLGCRVVTCQWTTLRLKRIFI